MTLFSVEGDLGTFIVIVSSFLWIGGVVDSARLERYGWTAAIAVLNFPAAILWFALRPIMALDEGRSEGSPVPPSPPPSFKDAAARFEQLTRDPDQ